VLRESCSQTVETEQPGNDLVETVVEVEVRNGTSEPISVHRDGFRLGASDGSAIRPSTWFANDPLSVEPGQALTLQLRFMSRGGLSCSKEMALESPSAVVKGAEPVKLGAVKFVQGHAPCSRASAPSVLHVIVTSMSRRFVTVHDYEQHTTPVICGDWHRCFG
jgi:hypothetical protein